MLNGSFQWSINNSIRTRWQLSRPCFGRIWEAYPVSKYRSIVRAGQDNKRAGNTSRYTTATSCAGNRVGIARLLTFAAERKEPAPRDPNKEVSRHDLIPHSVRVRQHYLPRADCVIVQRRGNGRVRDQAIRVQVQVKELCPYSMLRQGRWGEGNRHALTHLLKYCIFTDDAVVALAIDTVILFSPSASGHRS